MLKQQAFDIVAQHLLTQNQKSIRGDGQCVYRSGNLKCAVGCLIPDDQYQESFDEGKGISIVRLFGTIESPYGQIYDFLEELRAIHDDYDPEQWRGLLKSLAVKHLLVWKY